VHGRGPSAIQRPDVEAFELFAKDGLSAQEVAEQLGMTTNAVYLAKQHILKRIRELLPYMEEAY
jgi:DNA-directed RNA polymerase specialized sigma24 family protein